MAVLSRDALEGSPLADLHVLAGELGIDGYRRLRKADLVEAVIERQGGEAAPAEAAAEDAGDEVDAAAVATDDEEEAPKRRSRRGGRRKKVEEDDDADNDAALDAVADEESDEDEAAESTDVLEAGDLIDRTEIEEDEERPSSSRRSRGGRGGRGRSRDRDDDSSDRGDRGDRGGRGGRGRSRDADEDRPSRSRGGRDRDQDRDDDREDVLAEGTVELLGNGSGFLRISPPEPSDGDVYISAAQIRRCELVSGDQVTGPVRPPRRSERYPSLVRIDTINGRSADEVAEGTPFDDLPCTFPDERLALGSDDATMKAIEWLTPLGRGSRATIVGGARAGKTEALRRLAATLSTQEDLEVTVVLAGVRPEEVAPWREEAGEPATVMTFAASPDAQAQAIERAVDTAKRVAARGGNAVVLIDTLSYLDARSARRILSAARNIVDGGSLTIVAAADLPLGGETTVIALDAQLTSTGRFPALDLVNSGALKPELLVGDAGAEAIAQARGTALGG